MEIETLKTEDTVVYSGLWVYLKRLGEPSGGFLKALLGRRYEKVAYPPDDPKDLTPEMKPVVAPLLMVKQVDDTGWDYCEWANGKWRQLGLEPNPNAPLGNEYFANLLPDDAEFSIECEGCPLPAKHRRGFEKWGKYWAE